jgi:hypothetical protein
VLCHGINMQVLLRLRGCEAIARWIGVQRFNKPFKNMYKGHLPNYKWTDVAMTRSMRQRTIGTGA